MSSDDNTSIRVENLSKCYRIYDHPKDRLKQAVVPKVRALLGAGGDINSYYREFWALNNISFEIFRGETVGIVGRNGSGKSTLLQMICGTLEPTIGAVETQGRVAALLELGAGFNPDFTGRENVYMNATVLGLTQDEIHDRFEEITSFADIGDFIEQPVKHYSSGMYARLAFAIAINVDPSILVVDEALAVGDEPFQRKCFAKIEEIKQNGGTILFVSHAASTVVNLCDRAILLHGGKKLYIGQPKAVVSLYQKLVNAPEHSEEILTEIEKLGAAGESLIDIATTQESNQSSDNIISSSTDHNDLLIQDGINESSFDPNLASQSMVIYKINGAEIVNQRIESHDNQIVNMLINGQKYNVCYEVKFERDCEAVRFRCMLKTTAGIELGGGTYPVMHQKGISTISGQIVQVSLEFTCNLNPGVYFINCGLSEHAQSLHRITDAIVFRVLQNENSFSFGVVDFNCKSKIEFDVGNAVTNV